MPLGSADIARPHLLPAALADKLVASVARAAAALAGGVAAFGWVGLLTWSASDPSFSQATSGPVANALGIWGATAADALLQILGAASVIALLFTMSWSVELAVAQRIESWPARLCLAPIALLAAAGAASALPRVAAWSFHHGYGGVTGDLVTGICASLFAFASPIGAQIMSGVILGAGAIAALAYSLGVWPAEAIATLLPRIEPTLKPPTRPRHPGPTPAGEDETPPLGDGRSDVDPAFEAMTERASDIAQRFAPDPPRATSGLRPARPHIAPRPERRGPVARTWRTWDIALLHESVALASPPDAAQMRAMASAVEAAFAEFGLPCTVRSAAAGPVVTSYELAPASTAKCERIVALAGDICRAIGPATARAVLNPGKRAVVLEIPHARPSTVRLRDVLARDGRNDHRMSLPLPFGLTPAGQPFVTDLASSGHVLVVGAAHSDTSVCLHALILSLMYRLSPEECRFAMIDSATGEFSAYDRMPHLAVPIAAGSRQAISQLDWALAEISERRKLMAEFGANTIERYNALVSRAGGAAAPAVQTGFDPDTDEAVYEPKRGASVPMPRIVIIIDDLAGLLRLDRNRTTTAVSRLLQDGASAGLHVIAATRYPEDRMALAQLERSFPCRAALKAPSRLASRVILGEDGAEQLLERGDMLVARSGHAAARAHGGFVSAEEIAAVVQALREQGGPGYPRPRQKA